MVADIFMSGGFTLLLLVAAEPLGEWLAIDPIALRLIGAVLAVHVAILGWSVRSGRVEAGARYAVVANGAWVVAAAVVLLAGWLVPVAAVALVVVSVAVGGFAVLQVRGLAA